MKVLLVLLVLLALAAVAYLAVRRALAQREQLGRHAAWELEERSDGELVTMYAIRPGSEPLLIGSAAFAADDFAYRIEELRARGDERLVALNARRLPR